MFGPTNLSKFPCTSEKISINHSVSAKCTKIPRIPEANGNRVSRLTALGNRKIKLCSLNGRALGFVCGGHNTEVKTR